MVEIDERFILGLDLVGVASLPLAGWMVVFTKDDCLRSLGVVMDPATTGVSIAMGISKCWDGLFINVWMFMA